MKGNINEHLNNSDKICLTARELVNRCIVNQYYKISDEDFKKVEIKLSIKNVVNKKRKDFGT